MESTKEEMLNYLNKLADYCIPMDGGKMRMTSQVWAIVEARDAAIRAESAELLLTLKNKIEQAIEEVRAIETYDAHCTLDEALAALKDAGVKA